MHVIATYKQNQVHIDRLKLERIIKEELFREELERKIHENMGPIVSKAKRATKEFLIEVEEAPKSNLDLQNLKVSSEEIEEFKKDFEYRELEEQLKNLQKQLDNVKEQTLTQKIDEKLVDSRIILNTIRWLAKWGVIAGGVHTIWPVIKKTFGVIHSVIGEFESWIPKGILKEIYSVMASLAKGTWAALESVLTSGIKALWDFSPWWCAALLTYVGTIVLLIGIKVLRHFTSKQSDILDPAFGLGRALKLLLKTAKISLRFLKTNGSGVVDYAQGLGARYKWVDEWGKDVELSKRQFKKAYKKEWRHTKAGPDRETMKLALKKAKIVPEKSEVGRNFMTHASIKENIENHFIDKYILEFATREEKRNKLLHNLSF